MYSMYCILLPVLPKTNAEYASLLDSGLLVFLGDCAAQAKVTDFGLLKDMVPEGDEVGGSRTWADAGPGSTSRVAGTPGYLDPEYYRTFKATTKSDVFRWEPRVHLGTRAL